MNALFDGPAAAVLSQLHRDAKSADEDYMRSIIKNIAESGQTFEQAIAELIAEERRDYPAMYRKHADKFLGVSAIVGRFLYMIVRASGARRIVEFGTSMGISTIYLAAALRDNGGGFLVGSEIQPTKAERARAHLEAAGLGDLVDIRVGDALETLMDVGGEVDLLMIDGAFALYLPVLKLIEPKLRSGAIIVGENAFEPGYLNYVRDSANGYISQPLPVEEGRGNEFSIRIR